MPFSLIIPALNALRNETPSIDRIDLDISESEEVTYSGKLANHPIEFDNQQITDHFIKDPISFSIDAVVTDSPVTSAPFLPQVYAVAGLLGKGRMKTAREGLIDLYNNPRPVTISTSRAVYNRMIMISATITNDGDTGNTFRFSAQFQQVRIVSTATIQLTLADKKEIGDQVETEKKRLTALNEEESSKSGDSAGIIAFGLEDTYDEAAVKAGEITAKTGSKVPR